MGRTRYSWVLVLVLVAAGCPGDPEEDDAGHTTIDVPVADSGTPLDPGTSPDDTDQPEDPGPVSPELPPPADTPDDGLDADDADDADDATEEPDIELPPAPASLFITVNGGLLSATHTYDLPTFTPGGGDSKSWAFVLANVGDTDLTVTSVQLAETNADDSPKNAWVSLEWGAFDPELFLPLVLAPQDKNPDAMIPFTVVFTPDSFDENDARLVITTDDPMTPVLNIDFIAPTIEADIQLAPGALTFAAAGFGLPESQDITVDNAGIGPLAIESIEILDDEAGVFSLIAPDGGTAQVAPADTPGYAPATITVQYEPVFGSDLDTATLRIVSNSPDESPLDVPLSSTFQTGEASPCVLSWPGSEGGVVDFTATSTEALTITLAMKNVGAGVCTLDDVSIPEDPEGSHYAISLAYQPGEPEAEPVPIEALPVGIGSGLSFLITITYTPGEAKMDASVVISYQDPFPKTVTLPTLGGGPEPCIDLAPGSASEPLQLQFGGSDGASVTRELVIYSCGDAPLTVSSITVHDQLDPTAPSALFVLGGAGAGPHVIPPHSVFKIPISATISTEPDPVKGGVTINYELSDGPGEMIVPLIRDHLPGVTLPTAQPGTPADYPGAVAGEPLTLDGSASSPGSQFLANNGYTWFLTAKPSGSKLVVNGPTAGPHRIVTPDVPGTYGFDLIVRSLGTTPHYSQASSVSISVAAPPAE